MNAKSADKLWFNSKLIAAILHVMGLLSIYFILKVMLINSFINSVVH